jgi:hypothetical protein
VNTPRPFANLLLLDRAPNGATVKTVPTVFVRYGAGTVSDLLGRTPYGIFCRKTVPYRSTVRFLPLVKICLKLRFNNCILTKIRHILNKTRLSYLDSQDPTLHCHVLVAVIRPYINVNTCTVPPP